MCGVVGTLAFESSPFLVTEQLIVRMRDSMAHRGPDGAGAWVSSDRKIGLGHRRLSIIDLSQAAAQPMSNADSTLWISYNGEIYNHAEIRSELEKTAGYRWKTDHADTEVILHAFQEWGIDCLRRFRGMFAFALWDARRRELWLVRDRIGVKPLYYSVHHGRISFASEIKALLADPEQSRAVDEDALFHYLSFLTTPAPCTLFAGIRKLPPGTWLRVSADGTIRQQRYWELWDHVTPLQGYSDEELAERVREELRLSVQLRKVSDVPVGVFLSGGVDSSTNTMLFSEGEQARVKTFSIGYRGQHKSYKNELQYARLMADAVHAEHHELLLDAEDLIGFLPRMAWLQDEPIADPVCVPVYYVSKLARDNGVTVCQVGEGADELFWGYPQWKTALGVQRVSNLMPRGILAAGLGLLQLLGRRQSFRHEWLRRGVAGHPVFWSGAEAFTEPHKKRLLSPRLREAFRNRSSWEVVSPIRKHFENKAWERTPLQWMSFADLCLRLPELLLMRVDKMSMGVGLEARVPFLDHKLVELAMGIPEAAKTRNGTLKHILKMAVRGLIPDALIDRPKQGFGVPVPEWFAGQLGVYARSELHSFCRSTDFLDHQEVSRLLDSGNGAQAWYLLNLALWWKTFIAR